MKKALLLIVVVIAIIAIYSMWIVEKWSLHQDSSFLYTGNAYQWWQLLFEHSASGQRNTWEDMIIDHNFILYTVSKPAISLAIQTRNDQKNITFNLKDSTLLQTGGNNRIQVFHNTILESHLNEDISLHSLTGVNYTITTTKSLFSTYTKIQGNFPNQYGQQNTLSISYKTQCGLRYYVSEEYTCDIHMAIDFDLPIDTTFDTITVVWIAKITK